MGSVSLSTLLGVALAISAGRASVTPHVVEVDRLHESRAVNPTRDPHAPPDAQIVYLLARFIKNVRSLSTDPIVVRANWLDALDYVTDHEGQALNDYAREANPFAKIGTQPITVEVIYVVRGSGDSFEIRWKEQTYEGGAIVKTESFTGVVSVVFKSPNTAEAIRRNPLGLYVDAFNWSRDNTK